MALQTQAFVALDRAEGRRKKEEGRRKKEEGRIILDTEPLFVVRREERSNHRALGLLRSSLRTYLANRASALFNFKFLQTS
ncbi:hypothetical protein K4039_07815 [Lyngbya sp. CCAP 1446/10]|uniref:hypothetical protein n=1 Tax=Lyngbya sp. CCAP 1446/10 TaxID=439293 RepID=UPI002237C30A|nr:hypothetical protein [Lyngbya sp. CCAP 1446/10]MCW6049991.1 hypothetical protein [Lyngbya sp. CCAP 1446/10]